MKFLLFLFFVILGSSFSLSSEEMLNNDYNLYDRPYSTDELRSGRSFLKKETMKMEIDDFDNPGMIWVERGKELFSSVLGKNKFSCLKCHNESENSLIGVVSNFPKLSEDNMSLVNLEQQINICLKNNMKAEPLALESKSLLSLSSYITFLSKGMPVNVKIDHNKEKFFKKGKELYFKRIGQMNLACNQCHDHLAGKSLRAETISQGHLNGFPSYLLRWGVVASAHRRFQFCNDQARAEPLEIGHPDYNALQLYITWRGNSLLFESPSVRR